MDAEKRASTIGTRLDEIRDLLNSGTGDVARVRIRELVGELRIPDQTGATSEPARLLAAHLKAAEAHIDSTRFAPAAESISKAIYIATHESQIALDAPDPQLNA